MYEDPASVKEAYREAVRPFDGQPGIEAVLVPLGRLSKKSSSSSKKRKLDDGPIPKAKRLSRSQQYVHQSWLCISSELIGR